MNELECFCQRFRKPLVAKPSLCWCFLFISKIKCNSRNHLNHTVKWVGYSNKANKSCCNLCTYVYLVFKLPIYQHQHATHKQLNFSTSTSFIKNECDRKYVICVWWRSFDDTSIALMRVYAKYFMFTTNDIASQIHFTFDKRNEQFPANSLVLRKIKWKPPMKNTWPRFHCVFLKFIHHFFSDFFSFSCMWFFFLFHFYFVRKLTS